MLIKQFNKPSPWKHSFQVVPKHIKSPSLLLGTQTALWVELVQTLLHHLFQQPLPLLVVAAFVLSQQLFCFSWQFRDPKSPEAPTASPALSSYTTPTPTQHLPPPWPDLHPHSLLPLLLWLQGHHPSTKPLNSSCDHHPTAHLPQDSSSPDKDRPAPCQGALCLAHNDCHTRPVFQKRS